MSSRTLASVAALAAALAASQAASSVVPGRSVSQGRGVTEVANIFECPAVANARKSPVGYVMGQDGTRWAQPADNAARTGPKGADMFNECSGVKHTALDQVPLPPIVEIDPDGEVITGYLIADNYFELFVNGRLAAVDPVTFTPFNSVIVRFRAKKPVSYAVKLIDWEENLGLGAELGGGGPNHPGDGGFIARFSDGTVTDASWKAQSFYIAPLASPDEVVEQGPVHATPTLKAAYPEAPDQAACAERCYAVHYPVPANWAAPGFDDRGWPGAALFTHTQMGIPNLPAYTNFIPAFTGAQVIWSSNLVFDNLVIARKTAR